MRNVEMSLGSEKGLGSGEAGDGIRNVDVFDVVDQVLDRERKDE